MAHTEGDQEKAQKAPAAGQREKAKNLVAVIHLKASPKTRWKVCISKNSSVYYVLPFHDVVQLQ